MIRRLEDTSPTFRSICGLFGGRPEYLNSRILVRDLLTVIGTATALILLYPFLPEYATWFSLAELVGVAFLIWLENRVYLAIREQLWAIERPGDEWPLALHKALARHYLLSGFALSATYAGLLAPLDEAFFGDAILMFSLLEFGVALAGWVFLTNFIDSRIRFYDLAYIRTLEKPDSGPVRVAFLEKDSRGPKVSGRVLRVGKRLALLTDEGLVAQHEWADVNVIDVEPDARSVNPRIRPLQLVRLGDEPPESERSTSNWNLP